MTRPHPVVDDQVAGDIPVLDGRQGQDILGHARVVEGAHQLGRAAARRRGGLEHRRRARGQGRGDPAGGNGQREVPRGGHHRDLHGLEAGRAHEGRVLQLQGQLGVVAAEVDGLADLRVGLVDRLAGLGGRHLDELAAPGGQHVADPLEDGGALDGAQPPPGGARPRQGRDEGVDVVGPGQGRRGCAHRLGPAGRAGHGGGDRARPPAVGGQRRVGIGGRREGAAGPLGGGARDLTGPGGRLGQPVLGAVGPGQGGGGVDVGQGGQEAVALAVEDGRVGGDVEDPGHEVLRRRVLLQAAHQVGDGDVELARVHHRHVEQEVADLAAHDRLQVGGHAREHLELHGPALLQAAGRAQLDGEGDVEQVLAGHAQPHGAGALGGHGPLQHPLVVGVRGPLGGPGGGLPAVDLGVDPLHGQVRALDEAHLDGRPAVGHAPGRPGLEAVHGRRGVGQVGLQDDAGPVVGQVGLGEDGGEDLDGQVQVLVVLHVEVEEGAVVAGQAVQGAEGLHAVGDDLLEPPGVVGAGDGRDLDGHVVDVVAGHQAGDLLQAAGGLRLPQDRLPQEVDVEAVAVGAQAGQGRAEPLVGGVDDEVAHDAAEDAAGRGGDGARGQARGRPAQAQGGGQGPGQEGAAPGRHAGQGRPGDVEVGGAHDVVDEAGGELQPVGVGQDAREQLGAARGGLVGGLLHPPAGALDGAGAELPQLVGARARGVALGGRGGWLRERCRHARLLLSGA